MAIKKNGSTAGTRRQVIPHLVVKGAAQAVEFYKKAFGAEELDRQTMPDGKLLHAEIRIGESTLMLADEFDHARATRSPGSVGATTCTMNIDVDDCDKWFNRATQAGAKELMKPADMFWGDRYAQITDPFGHVWAFNQVKEWLSRDEVDARMKKSFGSR